MLRVTARYAGTRGDGVRSRMRSDESIRHLVAVLEQVLAVKELAEECVDREALEDLRRRLAVAILRVSGAVGEA